MSVKGTRGPQGIGKVRGQSQGDPSGRGERVAKPSLFLGSAPLLLQHVGRNLGPTAGVGHPRAFAVPRFPRSLACSFSIGEVGNGLVLAQPLSRAVLGGNETSSCISLHQKCTHRCKPKPTHPHISAPTRACTRISTPVHAHKHRRACKHGCTVCACTCQRPVAHPARTNPASLFSSQGKDAAHQAACSSGPECCLLLPALSLPDLARRDHDTAPLAVPPTAVQTPTRVGCTRGVTQPRGPETEEKQG